MATAATHEERVKLQWFPGARVDRVSGVIALPYQRGTFRLLDAWFGQGGWMPTSELDEDVREARAYEPGGPQGEATVELEQDSLAVRCQFEDKELAKLVPGYRWVPLERRWKLPARPATLDILRNAFRELLQPADAERLAEWERNERARLEEELERARELDRRKRPAEGAPGGESARTPAAAAAEAAGRSDAAGVEDREGKVVAPTPNVAALSEGTAGGAAAGEEVVPVPGQLFEALLERMGHMVEALERVARALEAGAAPGSVGSGSRPPATVEGSAEVSPPAPAEPGFDWRSELEDVRNDPSDARRQALEARLQADDEAARAAAMVLLGALHSANGRYVECLRWLRRAFAAGSGLGADLEAEAGRLFQRAATLALNQALGAVGEEASDAFEALAREVLEEGHLGQGTELAATREVVMDLAGDSQLARRDRHLHALARLAQFVLATRGDGRIDEHQLGEFVRDAAVRPPVRSVALILLANVLYDSSDMAGWQLSWPRETAIAGDFSWVAETALELLKATGQEHPRLVPRLAVSALAIVAAGPRDWASREVRLKLVRQVDTVSPERGYAEFLAAYRLAADGQGKGLARDFKGYFEQLKKTPLDDSWPHLSEVLGNDSNFVTNEIIDGVLPAALQERGIRDLGVLLEAARFATGTQHGDNTLNWLADGIEDGTISGTEALDREQRLELFRLALDTARKKGHDKDADVAFQRLIREYLRQGKESEIPTLCEQCIDAFAHLRQRAMLAALEWALEQGEPFAELLERAISNMRPDSRLIDDFRDIATAFPQVRETGGERLEKLIGHDKAEIRDEALRGKSILVVGGHPTLQAKAVPRLEELGLKVDWLDAGEAKQGDRAPDRAKGTVDLVVVNTSYISHAASGRVMEAARSAGNRFVARSFTGPQMLVSVVRGALAGLSEDRGSGNPGPNRGPQRR
ncbi:DUF2325 domain-containing protein [Tepidiforma sp.]|uniref:DUF2325 domain-containing protein n=1 Tax=Tepidiforma sp. TaxID=2682230 RepID=UPI002ADDA2FD|nr:DUF2325 domain-containing protein [Tepidiforma sp.]